MFKNDERYWNIHQLNKWFAISSILFMISFVWMFIDDNDDEYKVYQRNFRQLEIQMAEVELAEELETVKNERVSYEEKAQEAQNILNSKKSLADSLEFRLVTLKGIFYRHNMNYQGQKSEIDALKYLVEKDNTHGLDHGEDHSAENRQTFDDANVLLHNYKLKKEATETDIANTELFIKEMNRDVKASTEELNRILADVQLVQNKLEKIDRKHMSFMNKVGDLVRDLPILDFMNPYYKVKQIVVPDIKYNVNFTQVPSVDRCTSCHLGITNPDFAEAEQPFRSHPNLETYLSSASPHPMTEFGCTGCHSGRARGTSFVSAVHMPDSDEEKARWEEEYDWEQMHHWLQPMLPSNYTEASCFKCHQKEAYINDADQLTLGLSLIEKSGCNGCHLIQRYQERRKAGPDLAKVSEKLNKSWTAKWIKSPKEFRHNTRMPHFFGQDNNSSPDMIKRNDTEIMTMVNYLFPNGKEVSTENDHRFMGDAVKGEELFNAVGCRGCHIVEPDEANMSDGISIESILKDHGPNLIGLGSKGSAKWVYNWIKNPSEYWPETRMPDLRLSDQEAKDITAYLRSFTNPDFEAMDDIELDKKQLENIAFGWLSKMNTEAFAKSTLANMSHDEKMDFVADKSFRYYGCFGCHNIPGYEDAKPIGTELTFEGSKPVDKLDFGYIHDIEHVNHAWFRRKLENPRIFDHGKESPAEDKLRMPNFGFSDLEIEALVTAILSLSEDEVSLKMHADQYVSDELVYEGRKLIKEFNCQGCHIIDNFGGQIVDVIGSAEFSPPSLNTQGRKTQPDWLFKFFNGPTTIRPNLQVRMPSFNMTDDQWNSIIRSFQFADDQLLAYETDHSISWGRKIKAGEKLASTDFGACDNCHFYGSTFPIQGAQAWAPNLAMAKDRLRADWIVDWLKDPMVIMPGTKMPAPFLPTTDLFEDDDASNIYGEHLIALDGDTTAMLEGIRDFIWAMKGQKDISNIVKQYFDENGYNFGEEESDEEDEWDDDEW
ncbi:MAG: c-type cytochrome [Candidatus Marinimicrobia bacterium]|jgi:cytochrome c2|nr:c-type cytochrome [Candidatus Neomarinimicrobiota bacterium]MBT3936388.1 c-type cytochrome [Candidatus Neomarinimicrobiota bacterium]MBT3960340.1 c-type cytochrome [Candidatus Neomarinimicrobiota bacterium]MBT4383428.1 c-type cytochrome [Candidatus Neomarinimicrobiota bacterium]MBT4635440.1 c-type cytochrome [Candidatus Neomarinimicrobiota bacterium]